MGAGKSCVGRALSAELGWTFEDLDERIELREGRTIADIFRESGEAGFRQSEHNALKALLRNSGARREQVIALGGGAFVQEANALLIDEAKISTVFLDANVDELWDRCKRQSRDAGVKRPLLSNRARFRSLYDQRRPHYMKASLRQETAGKSVGQIVAELIGALGLTRKRSRSKGDKR